MLLIHQGSYTAFASPPVEWQKFAIKLLHFESAGSFELDSRGVKVAGTFEWDMDGEKFFLDLKTSSGGKGGYPYERVTLLCDGESIATCAFSERMSRGCEVRIYPIGSKGYASLISHFPLRPHLGGGNFLPKQVADSLDERSERSGRFENGPYSFQYELLPNNQALLVLATLDKKTGAQVGVNKYEYGTAPGGFPVPKVISSVFHEGSPTIEASSVVFSRFALKSPARKFLFSDLEACETARAVNFPEAGSEKTYARLAEGPVIMDASISEVATVLPFKAQSMPAESQPNKTSRWSIGLVFIGLLAIVLAIFGMKRRTERK